MKASINFRDEQKPLFKAKLPFSILGFPLQSGFIAGEKTELCLTCSTTFKTGPSIKLSYRPNDSCNHLKFGIKAAVGFAPITISAELNLLGADRSSTFFLHFRPQPGDFSIRRSLQSRFSYPYRTQPQDSKEDHDNQRGTVTSSNVFCTIFSGLEVNARTAVPMRDKAAVRFRWSVKFQDCDPMATVTSFGNMAIMPCLVLNKVGIESMAGNPESSGGFGMRRGKGVE